MINLHTNDKLAELTQVAQTELNGYWDDLLPHSIDMSGHGRDQFGEYYRDIDGNPLYGRPDVNVFYLCAYDKHDLIPIVDARLPKTRNLISQMPGILYSFMVFIGPNSVIPTHLDDSSRPAFDPSKTRNVLLGVHVPSGDMDQLGIRVDQEYLPQQESHAAVFDANIPHEAWNRTDQWWVGIVLIVDAQHCAGAKYPK